MSALPSLSPRRELGRTGFIATRLGAGDVADRAVPFDNCVSTLRRALDAGLNVVDTAPNYEDGYSEQIVGAALAGRRAGVFVIDKVDHVDRPVLPQVGGSLERLGLPLAKQQGVGSVCFKTFAAGKLLGDSSGYGRPLAERPRGKLSSGGEDSAAPLLPRLTVDECLAFTLTLDPDVALLGMSFPNEQDAALAAASRFRPLSADELSAVRARAEAAVRGKGECWWNPAPPVG